MKTFGHLRPVRDSAGLVTGKAPSPACAVTRDELGGMFGADRRRRLVVTLGEGDLIALRPQGTRRTMKIAARDLYRIVLQSAALNFGRKVKEHKKVMSLKQARQKAREELGL